MPASKRRAPPVKPRRFSHTQPPVDLTTPDWQIALRRQFGRTQSFGLENVGDERVFSEFQVTNPTNGSKYRVAIRGSNPGDNYCACPDFATNLLGTCKHIEYVLGRLERRGRTKTWLRRSFEADYSEVWLRYGAQRHICFRPGRLCTPALLARARAVFDAEDGWRLRADGFDRLDDFLAAAQRSRHEVRCYDDALIFAAERRADDEHRRRLEQQFPQGLVTPVLRGLLKVPLYPYQWEGALFAARAGRAIIADEMGLGKTFQAIAAAEILLRHADAERVLVVCPTSLKHQWFEEIARLSGRHALVVGGPQRERATQFAQPAVFKITNYDTVRRDLDLINAWAPDLVIADEAQRIKNWDTKAARAMKQLQSRYALVLTGTPLENRLRELVSIVQFVDRYRLGPTWRFMERHQITADNGQVVGYKRLDEVATTLAPILIRRRKTEVLDQLPPRTEKVYMLPLTAAQLAFHEEHAETVARIVARWKKHHFLSVRDQKILMAALQSMRMVCDSTYLLDPQQDHGNKIPELLRVLDEALGDQDVKVVIFSQWLRSHELLSPGPRGRWLRLCAVPRRCTGAPARRSGKAVQDRPELPRVSVDRCRRCRAQPAMRQCGGEPGLAVESRGARATHRPRPSAGPASRRARAEFRRGGQHRAQPDEAARVQAVTGGRSAGWRRQGDSSRWQRSHPLHGDGGTCDRPAGEGCAADIARQFGGVEPRSYDAPGRIDRRGRRVQSTGCGAGKPGRQSVAAVAHTGPVTARRGRPRRRVQPARPIRCAGAPRPRHGRTLSASAGARSRHDSASRGRVTRRTCGPMMQPTGSRPRSVPDAC